MAGFRCLGFLNHAGKHFYDVSDLPPVDVTARDSDLALVLRALVDLHEFMRIELDPDPGAITDYLTWNEAEKERLNRLLPGGAS